jgi:hypothetical protein
MEKLIKRHIAVGTISALGIFGVAGCSEPAPNYSGEGRTYQVEGTVHDVEDDGTIHINEKQLHILQADRPAATWFKDGDGQNVFSDEFNFEPDYDPHVDKGFWSNCGETVTVGRVYDANDHQIKPTDLKAGQTVDITGSIRDERYSAGKSGCQTRERNVFDEVHVLAK